MVAGNKPLSSPVLHQIVQLKEQFRKKRLDQKICELYHDYMHNYFLENGEFPISLPSSVETPERIFTESGEQIRFSFRGRLFCLEFNAPLKSTQKAHLILSENGKVRAALKVNVEIGVLEPIDVESYIQGDWEESILALMKELRVPEGELSEKEYVTQVTTIHDLNEMKKNFGL